jgi:hypothetical protein
VDHIEYRHKNVHLEYLCDDKDGWVLTKPCVIMNLTFDGVFAQIRTVRENKRIDPPGCGCIDCIVLDGFSRPASCNEEYEFAQKIGVAR